MINTPNTNKKNFLKFLEKIRSNTIGATNITLVVLIRIIVNPKIKPSNIKVYICFLDNDLTVLSL